MLRTFVRAIYALVEEGTQAIGVGFSRTRQFVPRYGVFATAAETEALVVEARSVLLPTIEEIGSQSGYVGNAMEDVVYNSYLRSRSALIRRNVGTATNINTAELEPLLQEMAIRGRGAPIRGGLNSSTLLPAFLAAQGVNAVNMYVINSYTAGLATLSAALQHTQYKNATLPQQARAYNKALDNAPIMFYDEDGETSFADFEYKSFWAARAVATNPQRYFESGPPANENDLPQNTASSTAHSPANTDALPPSDTNADTPSDTLTDADVPNDTSASPRQRFLDRFFGNSANQNTRATALLELSGDRSGDGLLHLGFDTFVVFESRATARSYTNLRNRFQNVFSALAAYRGANREGLKTELVDTLRAEMERVRVTRRSQRFRNNNERRAYKELSGDLEYYSDVDINQLNPAGDLPNVRHAFARMPELLPEGWEVNVSEKDDEQLPEKDDEQLPVHHNSTYRHDDVILTGEIDKKLYKHLLELLAAGTR